jgi:hypothetical protein
MFASPGRGSDVRGPCAGVGLAHCAVALPFNTTLLALTINVAASLL